MYDLKKIPAGLFVLIATSGVVFGYLASQKVQLKYLAGIGATTCFAGLTLESARYGKK